MDGIDLVIEQWAEEKPDLDCSGMALFGRIMRLTAHCGNKILQCHKSYGLKPGEFDVLATLLRSGNNYCLTPSQLISTMMLTSGAMTNRLDKLEIKGLITRIHSKQDRRSVSIALTELGKKLIDKVIKDHVKIQNSLISSLSESEKPALNTLLKTWLSDFES